MKKLIILLLILGVVVGIFWFLNSDGDNVQNDSTATVNSAVQVSSDEPTDVEITFTDDGYNPQQVEISKGAVVEWVNESSNDMWPASNLHPTHGDYPVENGCIGSSFDACESIPNGYSWRFKFTEEGSWDFHDHLAPIHTGTVIVN